MTPTERAILFKEYLLLLREHNAIVSAQKEKEIRENTLIFKFSNRIKLLFKAFCHRFAFANSRTTGEGRGD